MDKVPTTDTEAEEAFQQYPSELQRKNLTAIYQCHRALGKNVQDAYMATLQEHLEIAEKAHGK